MTLTVEDSRDALAADFDVWVAVHGAAVLRFAFAVSGGRAAGEDLSYDEIGELMGTSPSTARSQVSRALESLREWEPSLDAPEEERH